MHHSAQAGQRRRRRNQELFQLGGTLLVAPVADPDQVDLFLWLQGAELPTSAAS